MSLIYRRSRRNGKVYVSDVTRVIDIAGDQTSSSLSSLSAKQEGKRRSPPAHLLSTDSTMLNLFSSLCPLPGKEANRRRHGEANVMLGRRRRLTGFAIILGLLAIVHAILVAVAPNQFLWLWNRKALLHKERIYGTAPSKKIVKSEGRHWLWGGRLEGMRFDVTHFCLDPEQFGYGLGREYFPALIRPEVVSTGKAESWLAPADRVLLLKIDDRDLRAQTTWEEAFSQYPDARVLKRNQSAQDPRSWPQYKGDLTFREPREPLLKVASIRIFVREMRVRRRKEAKIGTNDTE